jgi:hypothetical protein
MPDFVHQMTENYFASEHQAINTNVAMDEEFPFLKSDGNCTFVKEDKAVIISQ